LFSFKELPFDEEEKASAETVFAISNEEEIYMISITALNPLIYWQPDLIFLKKIHILIEKYAKLIKVIALFDTGATASITKPIILPSHL
jgi:hypothetical protein